MTYDDWKATNPADAERDDRESDACNGCNNPLCACPDCHGERTCWCEPPYSGPEVQ